ncbi:PilX N-terminal domain-containing pilus assembly protein [Azotobacter beijerinckii]|uniref:PilX N-terminal n=1 Tax=Azotobacter beijerinckii TaxID=170623 RepID=A0A1I3YNN6_9GAMM|nr:PilX N-terminal domain-containing pilus assembly protein [Azotobacter beijerinckii]SFA69255.1 hypothetical protein SAMN04244571_00029 [Azotobacter beijerinckii]SFK32891.1 hypothetical protein SAMN04244574_00187 [Azotobacter beijerinckii]
MSRTLPRLPDRQRGAVLLVVLVMLGILTLIVAAMVNSSNINFRIAGNQQYRSEAQLSAQNAIEEYISNEANFTIPLPTSSVTISTDLDGDGTDEFSAVVEPPVCLRSIPIKLLELKVKSTDDAPCYGSGAVQESGLLSDGVASGNSWCSKMMWDVQSTVNDAKVTNALVEVHQGIYLRTLLGTPCP